MANKTLGQLIEWLSEQDAGATVRHGFGCPHSDRGDYYNLAFDPAETTTYGEMLAHARAALGQTFTGYKGGEFFMGEHTDVLIGEWGECGEYITDTHFRYWAEQKESDNG
jgi:hypothetical protein